MSNGKINCAAYKYAVNATKAAISLIREPDICEKNMKLFCAKDLEEAFKAGAEWMDKNHKSIKISQQ